MKKIRLAIIAAACAAGPAAFAAPGPFPQSGGFSTGCNYWASHAGVEMWRDWNPERVAKDLDALAANGISVLRVFPLWRDFQPLTAQYEYAGGFRCWAQNGGPLENPECVDDGMMARFGEFCDMAGGRGMKIVVGLVTGWMSGRLFAPQGLERLDLLTDPSAQMWETRFVRRFVREMKGREEIVAWDVGNECNCMGNAGTRSAAWTWLNAIASAIRLEDATRPVVGGMHSLGAASDAIWNLRDQGEIVDVLTVHPYPLWTPGMNREPFDSFRNCLHATAESLYYSGVSGRPCFPEEAGDMGRNVCSESRAAGNVRASLFSCWAAGLGSFVWWCSSDFGELEFSPYSWWAMEGDLGLLDKDFRVKPVLAEMRGFSEFLKTFPYRELPRRKTDAVCLVSEAPGSDAFPQSFGAFALARQAGFDIEFAGAEGEIPEARFYIMPSGGEYGDYSPSVWRKILAKVRSGATLLATKGGRSAIPYFREATGNELDFAAKDAPSRREFELAAHPGRVLRLDRSSDVRILPRESETLGADASGEVFATVSRFGEGKVVFVNSAIERESFFSSDAYSGANPLYLVYREAARAAGVARRVAKSPDSPSVVLTEHLSGGGRTLVVAVNCDSEPADCAISIDGRLSRVWLGDVREDRIVLGPNGAAVFETDVH